MRKRNIVADSLCGEEIDIFENEWDAFVSHHINGNRHARIFDHHKDAIKESICIAKRNIGRQFGGENADSNEFGWMPILPSILMPDTRTWRKEITGENVSFKWVDWIGSLADKIQIDHRATMIIIGFVDPEAKPPVDAVISCVHGYNYPVWHFGTRMEGGSQNEYMLSNPLVIQNNEELHIQELCMRTGISQLRPIGAYFTTGDKMRVKDIW